MGTLSIIVLLNVSTMVGTVWGFFSTEMAFKLATWKNLNVSGSIVFFKNMIGFATSEKLPPLVK